MAETRGNEKNEKDDEKESPELPEIEEKESSRQFEGEFGGSQVSYTAKAATQVFEIKEAKASFFYVS